MEKLKIAHIVCDLMPGGGQKSTIDLIRATNDQFDNFLILLENKKSYEIDDIKTLYICKNKKIYKKLDIIGDYLLSKKLSKILQENKIDIAISHMEVVSKVLRYIKIPKVFYIRVDLTQELETLKRKSLIRYIKRKILYKKILNNQNIITISKEIKKNILNFIKPKKISNIYNPFDFDKLEQLSHEKANIPSEDYIIQIGSGTERKRQDILLKAFANIENKNIKLLLLGTEEYSEIKKIIKELNIKSRIIFFPFTKNPYPYIKKAKLLVVSSDREGLPRVIVESLFLQTPVVSTDCKTGPDEILTGNLSHFLAKVNNPDDLANKIDNALKSYPTLKNKYIEKFNKNTIETKFISFITGEI